MAARAGNVKRPEQPTGSKGHKELPPEERNRLALKREVAVSLGLWDKVEQIGWGGLSAAETGRVGAALQRRLREDNPTA